MLGGMMQYPLALRSTPFGKRRLLKGLAGRWKYRWRPPSLRPDHAVRVAGNAPVIASNASTLPPLRGSTSITRHESGTLAPIMAYGHFVHQSLIWSGSMVALR